MGSIAPAAFIFIGLLILLKFPMKDAESHHKLIEGLQEHKEGKAALDPYYVNIIPPPLNNDGLDSEKRLLLEHFFPTELRKAVNTKNIASLAKIPIVMMVLALVMFIPGGYVMSVGWDDLFNSPPSIYTCGGTAAIDSVCMSDCFDTPAPVTTDLTCSDKFMESFKKYGELSWCYTDAKSKTYGHCPSACPTHTEEVPSVTPPWPYC